MKFETDSKKDIEFEQLLTTREVSNILRFTQQKLYELRLSGKGPSFIKIENSIRYKKGEIIKYLKQCEKKHARK